MRRDAAPLLATAICGGVAVTLGLLGWAGAGATIALGLPLALLLPGYALSAATLPGSSLGPVERLLFSAGLSLALAALGGLALNLTPAGLGANSWALLLGGLTLAAAEVALRRTAAGPTTPPPAPPYRQIALLGLAALLAAVSLGMAVVGEARPGAASFTQLWLLPSTDARPETGRGVRLGIASREATSTDYLLTLTVDGEQVYDAEITLLPGARWEATAILPDDVDGPGRLEAILVRATEPGVAYRKVSAWRR